MAGGGVWYYCHRCAAHGDGFDLVAARQGQSRQEAARSLWASGSIDWPDPITLEQFLDLVQQAQDFRLRVGQFWEDCRRRWLTSRSPALEKLLRTLRLHSSLSGSRWLDGPGRVVGLSHASEAELLTRKRANSGKNRWFVGSGWADLLALPFQTAWGQLAGFGFVGRQGTPADRVYKCFRHARHARTELIDGGLWGLDSLTGGSGRFDSVVFAIEDPILALRLHLRHAQTADWMLPLVSWFDDGRCTFSRLSWSSIRNRRIVFWGFDCTPSLIAQAAACDGWIALVPLREQTPERVDHYFRLDRPEGLLQRALRRARPWREYLRHWGRQQPRDQLGYWWRQLQRYPFDWQATASELGEPWFSLNDQHDVRVVYRRFVELIERESGWFYRKTTLVPNHTNQEILVTDARFRILEVITDGQESRYRGVIYFRGEQVPFDEPTQHLEENARQWLVRACLRAGLGRPRLLSGSWKYNLLDLALSFYVPQHTIWVVDQTQTCHHENSPS